MALNVYEVPDGKLGGRVGRRNGPMGTRILEFSVRDPGSDFVIEFLPVIIQGIPRCRDVTPGLRV